MARLRINLKEIVMLKRKIFRPITLVVLSFLMIFQVATPDASAKDSEITVVAATSESDESSVFDGILDLVGEKGAGIVKDALPTVGDYLCSKVFDYIGIDYTDSYTKELKAVNEKLDNIQNDLREIIKNQERGESQNTIDSFFNVVDTFSTTIHPLYAGYNVLMRQEKEKTLTAKKASEEEEKLYGNLKNIVFGNGTSTGDLYLQLTTLLDKIIEPSRTINKTLMEHYVVTFENRWAFDVQSFTPKKEFLGYASTTVMEGMTLYTFKHFYEMEINKDDAAQTEILETRWGNVKNKSKAVFSYLQKEINAVEKAEKTSKDTNTITHYATGKKLSKKLYVGRFYPVSRNNHYTYNEWSSRRNRVKNSKVYALNNRNFINTIQSEFASYKVNYKKGEDFTINDYLKAVGFTCDDWNNNGLYRGQKFDSSTRKANHNFNFYLEYTDQKGSAQTLNYGEVRTSIFTSKYDKNEKQGNDYSLMAFVGTDGVLIGSYDKIVNTWTDDDNNRAIRDFISKKDDTPANTKYGKVW